MDAIQLTAVATTLAMYICKQTSDKNDRLLISSVLSQVSDTIAQVTLQEELLEGSYKNSAAEEIFPGTSSLL